jgi:LDH2 family malate/lactate/ureidoglycolate dehydrogenase
VIDVLHETPPLDPAQPVLVPGDPEASARAERIRDGIPIPDLLLKKIKEVCEASGVPCIL